MKWIKASERLPEYDKVVFLKERDLERWSGFFYQLDVSKTIRCRVIGGKIFESDNFGNLEWLSETEPPPVATAVEEFELVVRKQVHDIVNGLVHPSVAIDTILASQSPVSDAVGFAETEVIGLLTFMTIEDIKEGRNSRLRKYFTPNGECVADSYKALYEYYKNNRPVGQSHPNSNEGMKSASVPEFQESLDNMPQADKDYVDNAIASVEQESCVNYEKEVWDEAYEILLLDRSKHDVYKILQSKYLITKK